MNMDGRKQYGTAKDNDIEPGAGVDSGAVDYSVNLQKKFLDAVYQKYPRKMGKSRGMKTARIQCKKLADLGSLSMAVDNYIKLIESQNTEPQFIMYFSTFMNQWRDFLEEDCGTVSVKKDNLDLSDSGFDE